MAGDALRGGDVGALLDAVSAAARSPGDTDAVQALLGALALLVRCDVAFWHWLELAPDYRSIALVEQSSCDTFTPDLEPWLQHLPEHPVMVAAGGPVTRISDVWTQRQFRNTWLFQEVFRLHGLRHEVGVALPCAPNQRNVIVLSRQRVDFSERDRAMLLLLRPHLATAVQHWASHDLLLTQRQSQVLALVGSGLTDVQIARSLGITEATVGKHLEHIYSRTGVHSRVQASNLVR